MKRIIQQSQALIDPLPFSISDLKSLIVLITLLAKIHLSQEVIKRSKNINPEANEHQLQWKVRQEGLYLASQSAAPDEV